MLATLCVLFLTHTVFDKHGAASQNKRIPGRAYIHEDNRLNGYAKTHLLSHHFVLPFTINRVIQRPNPPTFCRGVPTGFCPTLRCQGILALHADLRYCESEPGDLPLPMSVTYRPNDFPALREHWMVDSGTSASCTPNRDYFSNYVPCALFLTDRNGA
ncbi:hypothetical protein DYB25_010685 [Aphanomyces astaci]|uniref:Uncharacterized protein n=1 Tax=Aphanomyces astaci TaxID=112090 RepID=A0A397AVW5_APHAT|nr:hypothetical protein DYB36_012974 [Aphanomyces astaci]RHY11933.1 hypothetical protein DYB25_010685 [Aphanomyces astaci]RHY55789.1 hypothetical protein DYB38_008634 [Aphanomyces astaci]RHY59587.1 hypothetical protein DYB30_013541 [Aphanomyces astaci]RHZ18706.1 hypothetical protein DYB31_013706 [Aphanomyces astaci]